MSKFFAKKLPDLEILQGEDMIAGDVTLRNVLESVVPFDRSNSRDAWFYSVSQKTGIRRNRIKSIFYNRQCRVWGDELARIQRAASAHQSQAFELLDLQGEITHEAISELKQLLAETLAALRGADSNRH